LLGFVILKLLFIYCRQYSASLQLDPSALMLDSDVIPDLLVEKCAAIAVKPGAVEGMSSAMEGESEWEVSYYICMHECSQCPPNRH